MPACRHLRSRIAFRAYLSGDRGTRRSAHRDGSLPVYRQLSNNPPGVFLSDFQPCPDGGYLTGVGKAPIRIFVR